MQNKRIRYKKSPYYYMDLKTGVPKRRKLVVSSVGKNPLSFYINIEKMTHTLLSDIAENKPLKWIEK